MDEKYQTRPSTKSIDPKVGPCIELDTHCKFCRKPITIEIAKSYFELGDPSGLIPIACCNHCAGLRVIRRKLEFDISFACDKIERLWRKLGDREKEEASKKIESLAKEYSHMIAQFHGMEGMSWDNAIVCSLIEKPREWPSVLSHMWKQYQECIDIS